MKRKAAVRAAHALSMGERAWVCGAIAVHISTAKDVRAVPNAKVANRNEVIDALESAGASAQHTEEARDVFSVYVRSRNEWLTHEAEERRASWGERFRRGGRADWQDARRTCIDIICVVCPEAGEMLLNAEEQAHREQPPDPMEPPTPH